MCGIIGIILKDNLPTSRELNVLLTSAEIRGQNGIGIWVYHSNGQAHSYYSGKTYSQVKEDVLEYLNSTVKANDRILVNCRAQPETEVETSELNIQPIVKDGIALTHNGSVSNKSWVTFRMMGYNTKIDSEAIINAYQFFDKDLKKTMEALTGGFAFILVNTKNDVIYTVTDFKPLHYAIYRDKLVIHSYSEPLERLYGWLNVRKVPGYTILGFTTDVLNIEKRTFVPNFYHPTWTRTATDELVLCIASGGIDSSLAAYLAKLAGYKVKLLHFDYGFLGEQAEEVALQAFSNWSGIPLETIDINNIYKGSPSALLDKSIPLQTGEEDYLKSTAAWVTNRNQLFLSIATTKAESAILSNEYDKVYITSGFFNLTESGFYPDNSEYFYESFFENIKYSTICGDRIVSLPITQNIMKTEEWILGDALGFAFDLTCSCDYPKVNYRLEIKEPPVILCRQCGSTKLSMWAAIAAGVKDPRMFYDRKDITLENEYQPRFTSRTVDITPRDIIERLILPEDRKQLILGSLEVREIVRKN